jgi:hypothetical protein
VAWIVLRDPSGLRTFKYRRELLLRYLRVAVAYVIVKGDLPNRF